MFAKPVPGRTTADAEGDVVVLLRHAHQPLLGRASLAAGGGGHAAELRELGKAPERGLLGHVLLTASPRTYYVVQYWESKEKLYAYAHASGLLHRRAWAIFNRKERAGKIRQHVGLWHEAYVVPEGSYESIYADMPAFGLAAAHGQVPVEKRGRYAKDRFAHRSARAKVAEEAR